MSRERENMAEGSSTPEGASTPAASNQENPTPPPSRIGFRQAVREIAQVVRQMGRGSAVQAEVPSTVLATAPEPPVRPAVSNDFFRPISEEEARNPVLPEALKNAVPFRQELKKPAEYKKPEEREQAEIEWLKGLMSRVEATGQSYDQFFAQFENRGIRATLTTLSEGALGYYEARKAFSKAAVFISVNIGGSVESFVKYDDTIGPMSNEGAMMKQKEVAQAFAQYEARAKNIQYKQVTVANPDGSPQVKNGQEVKKWVLNKEINPAFADEKQLDKIRETIAKELAEKSLSEHGITRESCVENQQDYDRILADESKIMYFSCMQAEVLWRTWMRSGLWNGIVFKVDENTGQQVLTAEEREKLFFAQATDYAANWDKYKENVNWGDSFDSPTTEFSIKRLLWNGLFHHKHRQGREVMRPYLYYGSQDFLSSYLSDSFIINSQNFLDKRAFVELKGQDLTDRDKRLGRRIFVKGIRTDQAGNIEKDAQGKFILGTDQAGNQYNMERLIMHSNGVIEIDSDNSVDLSQVDWTITGEDAYAGVFRRYRLTVADEMRGKEMGDGKVGNAPFVKPFEEAAGSIGNLDPKSRDIEGIKRAHPDWSNNQINQELNGRRAKGKIYKEDAVLMLLKGVLKYQTTEMGPEFSAANLSRSQVDNLIFNVKGSGALSDEEINEVKKEFMSTLDIPGHERTSAVINAIANTGLLFYERTGGLGIAWTIFMEFFRQSFSLK